METRIEDVAEAEIDALHTAITEQAAAGTSAETQPAETLGDPAAGPAADSGPDENFCQTILALCLERHARSVRNEFMRDLAPVCEPEQAERIANRAAMDPTLQDSIARHGARVLQKYGLARYVNDEAVLVGSVLAYVWELNDARRERDELLERLKPKPKAGEQPPAT